MARAFCARRCSQGLARERMAHLERRDAPTLPAIRPIARASPPMALPA